MIDPELMSEARALGFRALRVAEASAAGIGAIGSGHPHSNPPPGVVITKRGVIRMPSTGEQVQAHLNMAIATGSDDQLRDAIKWCKRELDLIQKGPGTNAETPSQFRWRLATEYPGVPAARVAARERTSETTVRNARREHGYTAARGHPLEATRVEHSSTD